LFKVLFGVGRQLLRSMVGGWTLEAKSLLFLGVALVVPIGLSFWFVLEVVAEDLVMRTTQQSARDYARTVIAWEHVQRQEVTAIELDVPNPLVPLSSALGTLRQKLVENPHYKHEFLTLRKDAYSEFGDTLEPTSELERSKLLDLERRYRELEQKRMSASEENRRDEKEVYFAQFDPEDAIFADAGPVFLPVAAQDPAFVQPPEGWYVYYHVVQFSSACIRCHSAYPNTQGPATPFHVVKVMLPFSQTKVGSPTTLAVMISIAMVTVAATLLVVHWVLRRLVLRPLQHLKNVSEEIITGNTDTRANIDTGDEFDELADAFNRMLRHMTEGQEKLRTLNQELDVKVDQLAQANLKLYEANRLKSDFLANMSHELRTPLNSIIGFSDVLQDITSLTDKQRRYAQNIQKSGRLLLEMINDILDLAKVEAGKMNVVPVSFSLPAMVEAQCDMLRSLADEKNMDLRCEVPEDMEPVFQDQAKLQQILTNLLSNAIKFTPDGGLVTVQVGLLGEQMFFMTVADTGVGIPEEDFEIIFEKFRQSSAILQNDGLKRQYSGTGLGLSIVKELCKLLGGEIRLTSQLGTGSRFQVTLPVHYHQSMGLRESLNGPL
jgi:two-component system, NarL family, sensor histidine kinase BarA